MRTAAERTFAGADYDSMFDGERLSLQIERIRTWAVKRQWFTLREASGDLERLYAPTLFPEGSISAQLRNLEKPTAGQLRCKKDKRRRAGVRGPGAGIFEYRIRPEPHGPQLALFIEPAEKKTDRAPAIICFSPAELDDGGGREEFFREARRIAGLPS
jgi:hypothetical protein